MTKRQDFFDDEAWLSSVLEAEGMTSDDVVTRKSAKTVTNKKEEKRKVVR